MPYVSRQHSAKPIQHWHVLVVNAYDKERYAEALRSFRFEVSTACSASDARAALARTTPHVVVVAAVLPDGSGIDLARQIKDSDKLKHTDVILLATFIDSPRLATMRGSGADAIVLKPCLPVDLRAHIERVLAGDSCGDNMKESTPSRGAPEIVPTLPERVRCRRMKSRTYVRFTTTTPTALPPDLPCPVCHRSLDYENSYIGGVSADSPEQWDQFVCGTCGRFEYRHRTRKLRRALV